MKFEIGDKVLILHSKEEGEIIDIINKDMVMVEVHGVKFPAYIDQLDFPYFQKFTEKKPRSERAKNMSTMLKKKSKIKIRKLPMDYGLHFFLFLISTNLAMNL